jgi:hypothetical protein
VDHGIGAAQHLDRLSEVGQVGAQQWGDLIRRGRHVDVDHLDVVIDQVAHHGASGLAAPSRHHDSHRPSA